MVSATYNNGHLTYLRDIIDFAIDEISYTQNKRHQIPVGYMGNDLFLKSFDDIYNESDAAYLRSLYVEHNELYKYECAMIEKLTYLRTVYDDIESTMYIQEMVADAKARGVIPMKDSQPIYIGNGSDSYDDIEAFGETYEFA